MGLQESLTLGVFIIIYRPHTRAIIKTLKLFKQSGVGAADNAPAGRSGGKGPSPKNDFTSLTEWLTSTSTSLLYFPL